MESTFSKIRQELDELGYTETLKPDCLPLVRRILSDLKITTENLKKYVGISKQALEERDYLKLGAEPYKCDNAKLIRECNELHLAFIQFKEQHEKVQKDLRTKISLLEDELTDSGIEKHKLLQRIRNLESELNKGDKLKSQKQAKSSSFQLNSVMAYSDQKIANLNKELRKLKEEQLHCIESNEFFKAQLQNRDEEIKRLNSLLEGGRPTKALSKDCCYKNIDNKIGSLLDEINGLKREKITLQNELKEAMAKQHEAMRRAIHLAERNKQLENEMKDIDQIALAVEAECNDTVKNNAEKVTRLQDKMNESIITIQNLERDNARLITEKKELSAELDAVKLEKKTLQTLLETETEDKKRLTDRINNFAIIEHDLNLEIDRLLRISSQQKRKIAELECKVTTAKLRGTLVDSSKLPAKRTDGLSIDKSTKKPAPIDNGTKSKQTAATPQYKKTHRKSSVSKQSTISKQSSVEEGRRISATLPNDQKCCCEAGGCVKSMKELLDKEMEYRQEQAMQQIESLRQEKDYYMKEYHKIVEEMRSFSGPEKPNKLQHQTDEMLGKIKEKDQTISTLQKEVMMLSNEKFSLSSRLDGLSRSRSEVDMDGVCEKTSCKRKARELEIHKEEVKHLERENDSLKSKIQALTESSVFDEDRMKKAFREMEEHIRKLENERRDLVVGQSTSRSNVTQLEEERKQVMAQLRATQNELNTQKASYNQLKILHDQTDRALSEAQSQLLRAETELQSYQSKVNMTHRESAGYEREIARLQGDVEVMKSNLSKIDKEKDELLNIVDEKTEKIDYLENQLKEKKNLMSSLEDELKELKRKLGKVTDETSSQEIQLRSSKQELTLLQQDYENEKKLKEAALQENRRLQDEMASVTNDVKNSRKELEISKRQVADLTRQLQHYVAEVKRTEDLISQKELERTEILDQFKCLSQEANILESSNHTLETEATQTKVQLSVALDHASDLERKLENQEGIIKSYERQITELTTQVASLEIQMKQSDFQSGKIVTELKQMKDLCIKLDNEKDELNLRLQGRDEQKNVIERTVDLLNEENEKLRKTLERDKNDLDEVEKLLNDARKELVEQRLLNQDLQSELARMRAKVNEMQQGLTSATEQVDLYQEKAFEYIQQNKQLRRDITNERFTRAKENDNKRYPSF